MSYLIEINFFFYIWVLLPYNIKWLWCIKNDIFAQSQDWYFVKIVSIFYCHAHLRSFITQFICKTVFALDSPSSYCTCNLNYSATSQLQHHSWPKINVVKQRCHCSEVFKMADKSACRDFHTGAQCLSYRYLALHMRHLIKLPLPIQIHVIFPLFRDATSRAKF